MKFYADRKELKGPLGGTYYESHVRVELTPQEQETAQRHGIMREVLVGGDLESREGKLLMTVCSQYKINLGDLTSGIVGKVSRGANLGLLAEFESLVRESCKKVKSNLDASEFFSGGGSQNVEEF